MPIDSILHIMIGGLITIIFFANKVKGYVILLSLVFLALGKEFYDHYFVLGHCYPQCMHEHMSDFFLSLIFFFLYLPILSFSQQNTSKITYKHYGIIWVCFVSAQLFVTSSMNTKNHLPLMAGVQVCKAD